MQRRTLITAAALAPITLWAQAAYPNKPIRIILPFTPGGTTDALARAIGQKLQDAELDYIVHSETGARSVAENYVGLPLDFGN